ncbi:cupin [Pseudaminobacter sp. NGMCC 1.201702]|uniref:cupin n=1 Tax=Pseudaminobacter sp. NGMCC 1.201702 TaxID=3391825 RepID=UPI0039F095B7
MPILETGKKIVERLTGRARPSASDWDTLLRDRPANTFHFKDDGVIPNHPRWPLIVYRSAVQLPDSSDPAAIFEALFARNDWENSWRNGIYDYVHYHSRVHEVLGVARGSGKVRFGGKHGRILVLKAGDVAVLPTGTGHQSLGASDDFLVVGAYPPEGTYDECTGSEDHGDAVEAIAHVAKPRKDPIYGEKGALADFWKASR